MERLAGLRSNPHVVDASTSPLFTPAECASIIAACPDDRWREVDPPDARSAERHKVEQALPGGNHGWIGERIAARVAAVNEEIYGFELLGLEEPVRVFSYGAEAAGQFQDHIDLSPVQAMRKLTFSILLSDPETFEGGNLEFSVGAFPDARRQGVLTLFPSFVLHRVTQVSAGQRVVVVGWAVGPTFR